MNFFSLAIWFIQQIVVGGCFQNDATPLAVYEAQMNLNIEQTISEWISVVQNKNYNLVKCCYKDKFFFFVLAKISFIQQGFIVYL